MRAVECGKGFRTRSLILLCHRLVIPNPLLFSLVANHLCLSSIERVGLGRRRPLLTERHGTLGVCSHLGELLTWLLLFVAGSAYSAAKKISASKGIKSGSPRNDHSDR